VLNFADDDEHTALLVLLTKAAAWRYEQEYRLIAQDQATALGWGSLITAGNLLTLPPGALQAVIVGCSTPPDMRAEIRKIVQASSRDIAVKQAVRVPNRYELAIEPL
jgi:hypothetical protein